MRLICPNCDAQYEVDPAVIPAAGRDVQCSNCGHVWYQYAPGFEPDEAVGDWPVEAAPASVPAQAGVPEGASAREGAGVDAPGSGGRAAASPSAAPTAAPGDARPPVPAASDAGLTGSDPDEDDDDARALPAGRGPVVKPSSSLDDSLRALLREEAARETAARAAAAARAAGRGVEMQPDLGFPDTSGQRRPPPRAALPEPEDIGYDEGFAVPGTPVPEDAAPDSGRASRRDLLPDIEQINSTLRASTERRRPGGSDLRLPDQPEMRARSFRTGFLSMVALAGVGLALYVFAPRITETVPALGPALDGYVAMVDRGRAAVDRGVTRMLTSLQGAQTP